MTDEEAVEAYQAWLKKNGYPHTRARDVAFTYGYRAAKAAFRDQYDRGRRDMLNAILALNPGIARRYHEFAAEEGEPFTNVHGKIPFDVLYWVCAVAEQLGIQPKEDADAAD